MATPGQLKTKIDLLKKKIAEKGSSLTAERRRQLGKRLKRLQRSRRVALGVDRNRDTQSKAAAGATKSEAPAAGPA
ncbi:MAG TPA: hypothetical protein VFT43_04905 [Candidatus Polarisedimenticolia bacterium]|nr:hypothetical protein [Candidatus Polarisedimenticolia bacterium]